MPFHQISGWFLMISMGHHIIDGKVIDTEDSQNLLTEDSQTLLTEN